MSFSADLAKYAKNLELSLDEAAYSVCSQAAELIIDKTPVDKGMARANWVATINKPSNLVLKKTDKDGSITIAKAKAVAKMAGGNIFYLTNNLPYIRKLEYGGYSSGPKIVGGFSIKAPAGMVRISMMELKSNIKKFK